MIFRVAIESALGNSVVQLAGEPASIGEPESLNELLPQYLPDGLWEELNAVWAAMGATNAGFRFEDLL